MGVKENVVKAQIMRRFGRCLRIWNSPTGVGWQKDRDGNLYRFSYGLCPGAHDMLIEIPRLIQASDVGTVIGQFGSIEAKRPGAKNEVRPDQIVFGQVVERFGGLPIFADSVEDVERALAGIVIAKV